MRGVSLHITYIDESGDTGSRPAGGSQTYTLSSVAVPADTWADVFDELVKFRRHLRDRFRLPMRAEVKASWLMRGSGDLRPLGLNDSERRAIFDLHMKFLAWHDLSTFAVVIDKPASRPPNKDVSEVAWATMFQRLERFATKGGGPIVITHDEGDDVRIRKHARRRRRFGTAGGAFGGALRNDFRLMVDDPTPKNSKESYFVQLADLVAYAAFRACVPPRPRRVNVVDARTYSRIGSARNVYAAGLRPRGPDKSIVYRADV